ncbi:hypothetical protein Hanom_Chr12g01115261 [Helianthus anomalus]
MLRVGNSVTNHILQKYLQNTTCLFIYQTADSLDSTSSGQPPDGGFGDTLNVIPKNFPVTLCSSLSQPLSSFSTSRHCQISVSIELSVLFVEGDWLI